MKGDFSRITYRPTSHFSRVMLQQGRVQLDSDWNEQTSIQLQLLRSMAADLIGPHGGPGEAFKIEWIGPAGTNFVIKEGHYYVDGLLCENEATVCYAPDVSSILPQPWLPLPPKPLVGAPALVPGGAYLVYLDVWERHICAAQDDSLREVALGGPDSASRTQLIWQAKLIEIEPLAGPVLKDPTDLTPIVTARAKQKSATPAEIGDATLSRLREVSSMLLARAMDPIAADESTPCLVSPQARYRGIENQLYRVEIHRGGVAAPGTPGGATFVWSRENGAVTFAVANIAGARVQLAESWHDARFGLSVGDYVEIVDDVSELTNRADDLCRVQAFDKDSLTVTLDKTPFVTTDDETRHVILRLWNHCPRPGNPAAAKLASDNALELVEGSDLQLEDGITIQFQPSATSTPARYRTGDYWLIPARTATADIIWPCDAHGAAIAIPPHGIAHHYAPLAILGFGKDPIDLRKTFAPLAK